jgi:hypothetical protein
MAHKYSNYRGRPRKYPWKTWFKNSVTHLVRGKDYQCEPYSLAIQIRRMSNILDIPVTVSVHAERVTITRLK